MWRSRAVNTDNIHVSDANTSPRVDVGPSSKSVGCGSPLATRDQSVTVNIVPERESSSVQTSSKATVE